MSLSEDKIKKINILLASIVQAKDDICDIVNRKCKNCPLNQEDKCNELNLAEFNFDINQWER